MNENKATIAYYIFKNQHKIEKRRKHLKEEEEEGGKEDREEEDKMKWKRSREENKARATALWIKWLWARVRAWVRIPAPRKRLECPCASSAEQADSRAILSSQSTWICKFRVQWEIIDSNWGRHLILLMSTSGLHMCPQQPVLRPPLPQHTHTVMANTETVKGTWRWCKWRKQQKCSRVRKASDVNGNKDLKGSPEKMTSKDDSRMRSKDGAIGGNKITCVVGTTTATSLYNQVIPSVLAAPESLNHKC